MIKQDYLSQLSKDEEKYIFYPFAIDNSDYIIKTNRIFSDIFNCWVWICTWRMEQPVNGVNHFTIQYIADDFKGIWEAGRLGNPEISDNVRKQFYRIMAQRFGKPYINDLIQALTGFDKEFLRSLPNNSAIKKNRVDPLRSVFRGCEKE